MSEAPEFRLEAVSRGYGGPWRLEVPDLVIRRGEIFGLIGPTGAGKTTLLRLLHLLDPLDSGRIEVRGRPVAVPGPVALRREIGMVFQRPPMLSGSVRDNVGLGLRLRGRRDPARLEELLARCHLQPLAAREARSLSGGEMQRAALARALAYQPRVLLLDEPAANLDPGHLSLIEGIIREEHRRAGTTIILATHNLAQARRLTRRLAVLAAGRVLEIGSTASVFRRPRNPQTAAYLRGGLLTSEAVA